MSKAATQPISIRIGADKVEELDELARATDRSRAWHVEQALAAYLDLQRWQLRHIEKGLDQLEAGEGIPQEEIEAYLDCWGADPDGDPRP